MAKKSLTKEQIAMLLQATGGNIGKLTDLGIPKNQIMVALLSNPEILNSARTSASSRAGEMGLDSFREDFEYDPESNINAVSMAYEVMPDKFKKIAGLYFEGLKGTKGVKTEVDKVNEDFDIGRQEMIDTFGLTDDEFDDFKNTLKKDADNFLDQENTKRRNQYKAFMGKQKQFGIKEGVSAGEGLLAEESGFRGLSSLPSSFEDFSAKESEAFKKSLKGKGKNEAAINALLPQFQQGLKDKTGKNYQSVAVLRFLKQNLLGE